MRKSSIGAACLWLAAASCGDGKLGGGVYTSGGSGPTSGAGEGEASGDGEASADGTGSGDGEGETGPIFDVQGDGDGDTADGDEGCSSVDILFVIDNSGSMCLYQEGLAGSFPGFADAMYDALPAGTDLHVAITTSGFALGGSHAESNCEAQESQQTIDQYYTRPTEGMVMGNGLQGRLLEWQGKRWFEVDTADLAAKQPLEDWFSGAATSVGCGVSSFEFNASGAAWALHPANAGQNDGFLRDEGAVLLIFVLSDEADQSLDMETLDFLHDTVAAAKSGCGGDECIISGGLLGPWCVPDQNAAYKFMETFGEEPVWDSIGMPCFINCVPPDYGSVLGDALAQVVAQTCEDIPPEG